MKPGINIFLKVVETLLCATTLIIKAISDQESRKVFLVNQKLSREWGLLHNITWSKAGNAFTNVTFGGFTLITSLLLISRIIDKKGQSNFLEKLFLLMGVLLFFAVAGLVFASIDQVPSDLHNFAIILGCLSCMIALLFIIDLSDPLASYSSNSTQTKLQTQTQTYPTNVRVELPEKVIVAEHSRDERDSRYNDPAFINQPNSDTVERTVLPRVQTPVFEKVYIGPEKIRPMKKDIPATYRLQNKPERPQIHKDERIEILREGNKSECCAETNQLTSPIFPGYVQNAARIWEKRTKAGRPLNTIV